MPFFSGFSCTALLRRLEQALQREGCVYLLAAGKRLAGV